MNQNDWLDLMSSLGGPPVSSGKSGAARTRVPTPGSPRRSRIAEAFRVSRIVSQILLFVDTQESSRGDWYTGVTAYPSTRLTNGHGLQIGDPHKVFDAGSEDLARRVEKELLSRGLDGGAGGGSEASPRYVYIFLKQRHTRR
jgi:hypothetical protein